MFLFVFFIINILLIVVVDPKLNRVIWSINKKYLEHEYIEDILKKLPISKVDFLTESQVVPIREEVCF